MARHRRPARFVRRPDRFRLAPADRRRYGAAEIARRLEELPAGARVAVVMEVADRTAQIAFDTRADVHEIWRFRAEADAADGDVLLNAVRDLPLPSGDGYVWAAGEALSMRAVRQHLTGERGVDKSRIRAAAYWKARRPCTKRWKTDGCGCPANGYRLRLAGR